MQQALLGTVSGIPQATRVITSLKNAGFTNDDISVLVPDEYGAQELGYEKHSKAPEGISIGTVIGAIIGGVIGYLIGIDVISAPMLATLIIAGPFVGVLCGVAVGGVIGALSGGLIGLAVPEYEAKKYERKMKYCNTLLSVHTDNTKEAKVAEEIFKTEGVQDINLTDEESVKKKPVQLL